MKILLVCILAFSLNALATEVETDEAITARMRNLGYGKSILIPPKFRSRVETVMQREAFKLENDQMTSGQLQIILGENGNFFEVFKLPTESSRAELEELAKLILGAKDPTEPKLAMPGIIPISIPQNVNASKALKKISATLPDRATNMPANLRPMVSRSMRAMGMREWAETMASGGQLPPEVVRMWMHRQKLPESDANQILNFIRTQGG